MHSIHLKHTTSYKESGALPFDPHKATIASTFSKLQFLGFAFLEGLREATYLKHALNVGCAHCANRHAKPNVWLQRSVSAHETYHADTSELRAAWDIGCEASAQLTESLLPKWFVQWLEHSECWRCSPGEKLTPYPVVAFQGSKEHPIQSIIFRGKKSSQVCQERFGEYINACMSRRLRASEKVLQGLLVLLWWERELWMCSQGPAGLIDFAVM